MGNRLVMKLRVADMRAETPDVLGLRLEHPRRPSLPAWSAGAHVDVHLPHGGIRQYSLCGDPEDLGHYQIAVKREHLGRGGSTWLHEHLRAGTELPVSAPRNHFRLDPQAGPHLLIAGGIGVTPIAAMARTLKRRGTAFRLHYCARDQAHAPLLADLEAVCGAELTTWLSADDRRLDPIAVLGAATGARLYVCGPRRLTDAVEQAALALGWPAERFHAERFTALEDADFRPEPFEAVIASSGARLQVPAERSLLSVLADNGIAPDSSCEIGVCGACECGYLEGEVVHRDVVLGPDDRATRLMTCVSRGKGTIILDL
ncbi:vanillate O-demethylase ferredoxin subunit [Hoeflea marina]|uniref:Vanillate O-demethylase ferredoxin subunit n=1 Tax=Hoeflea marina TaxID=274592 RepID=A0A317PN34_9HYPH|nr:PDR/VanB family oxidoreductase [Hoeflea marina]PWW01468.1 vanillate O-demethylase ferredoxin subunit [Hoeflea marina]